MAKKRKSFPLRISQEIYDELRRWADQEMRSVNSQIEFLLREAVVRRKKATPQVQPDGAGKSDKESEPE